MRRAPQENRQSSAVELVCFDLGRVLVQICDGWIEACTIAGVEVPKCIMDQTMQQRLRDLGRRHETGLIDDQAHDDEAAALTGLSPDTIAAVCCAWLKQPYCGVDDLLDELASNGICTACLTNTNTRHWRMMVGEAPSSAALPLHRLNYRLASHLIGAAKPNVTAFKHVERTTGIRPHAILFFDDAPENCSAARELGWSACRISTGEEPVAQMRDYLAQYGVL